MSSVVALNYGGGPTFNVSRTLDRVVLNYASLKDNSNKFYIMEIQEGTGEYSHRIFTEYGRMGKTPRKEGRYYQSKFQAEMDFGKILTQKESKGYVRVDVDDGFSFGSSVATVVTKPNKLDLSSINDKVLKFIGKIYQATTSFLISSIETPVGKLTANQVAKGLRKLDEIEAILDSGHISLAGLECLSDEFYSIIPATFGSKVNYDKFIIDDYYKLNERKDLLGVMNSVVNVQKDLESTLEEKYNALNIKLKALSKRTKEYKRIVEKVNDTKGHNHHFGININEVYEVVDMKGFDNFNPFNVSTMELFHGSRNQNILGILQDGLKIKPKSAIHTGSMFGAGIYMADCSSKSANYCFGYGGGSNISNENFLFLCDVATGKIKEYYDAQPNLTKAPRGYNSVMGKKGSSLVHNEYIVFNENQVKLRYIIEFERD